MEESPDKIEDEPQIIKDEPISIGAEDLRKKSDEIFTHFEMVYGDADRDFDYKENVAERVREQIEEFREIAAGHEDVPDWIRDEYLGWRPKDLGLLARKLELDLQDYLKK